MLIGAVKATLDKWGKVDILVNNAGGPPVPGKIAGITEEDWDRTIAVDLKGSFLCCQRIVPEMVQQGKGKIVNISSMAGILAEKALNAYGVAKGALILFTKQLALDYGRDGINANAICPGYINTMLTGTVFALGGDKLKESIPCGNVKNSAEIGIGDDTHPSEYHWSLHKRFFGRSLHWGRNS